ncbi:hypothetical protein GLP37_20445 [Photobacterium phosphoreum]|uniref:hypothetical protein n=1 Tax=Photobacterium phosphoreum TaxID=659 RepID=UPI001E53CA4E|nr:hypothetical protein [Photobacterium phosphoreum]MCD9504536.1 hypothetical protein [Photobacterium phosphoreum]
MIISDGWKIGLVTIAAAFVWAGYMQINHFKTKSQTLEQASAALESRLTSEMNKAQATIENARKQVLQLAVEREQLSKKLIKRESERNAERDRLETNIKKIKDQLSSNDCFSRSYPSAVIKQLRSEY